MTQNKVFADILSMHVIPNVSEQLSEQYNLEPGVQSIGLVTTTMDDVGSVAIDEATKATDVSVVYAESFYAGSDYPSGPLSGEFIGIVAGKSPEEVKSALDSIRESVANELYFEAINGNREHLLFAKTISSCGSYLAKSAQVKEGTSLAYLIAPPLESIVGLDAALKAADVEIAELFKPPSETNFGGGILFGSQSSCAAAVDAFRDEINRLANRPLDY